MNESHLGQDWNSLAILLAYGILICLYLITLKLLLNCLEQIMSPKHTSLQRTVVDMDIRQEAANRHMDDKTHTFDVYNFALTFLKIIIILAGIVGIFVIIMLKFNVFVAFGVAAFVGVIIWQFLKWREGKGRATLERYDAIFVRLGVYNPVTLVFFAVILILITLGLILLPR